MPLVNPLGSVLRCGARACPGHDRDEIVAKNLSQVRREK